MQVCSIFKQVQSGLRRRLLDPTSVLAWLCIFEL